MRSVVTLVIWLTYPPTSLARANKRLDPPRRQGLLLQSCSSEFCVVLTWPEKKACLGIRLLDRKHQNPTAVRRRTERGTEPMRKKWSNATMEALRPWRIRTPSVSLQP